MSAFDALVAAGAAAVAADGLLPGCGAAALDGAPPVLASGLACLASGLRGLKSGSASS